MIIPELIKTLLLTAVGFSLLMTLSWILALRLKFISLVDAVWALGIGLGTLVLGVSQGAIPDRTALVLFLVLSWSFRLGIYLLRRLKKHFPVEDTRYQQLKITWQKGFRLKTFLFFQFQAIIQTVLVVPFVILILDSSPFPNFAEILGALLVIFGVVGESTSDFQLNKFKMNSANRGKVCDQGLWRLSRHPNYFFEWFIWLGFGVMAIQAPLGVLGLVSPLLMLYLLLFVTGVKPSEEQALKSKGDAYKEYQKTTSAFFPRPPKLKTNI